MSDENLDTGNINISDISSGDIDIGNIITGLVRGDVVGGDKVEGDKVLGDKIINVMQQVVIQLPSARDLPAILSALQQTLPQIAVPEQAATQSAIKNLEQIIANLPTHEQSYRDRIRKRYAISYGFTQGENALKAKWLYNSDRQGRTSRLGRKGAQVRA